MWAQRKVLVIGDDVVTQGQLVQALSDSGFHVLATPHDADALFQLHLLQPDLIVLDVPHSDRRAGKMLQRIRERSSVPIIVLAPRDDRETRIESLDHGADHCLGKPFDVLELQARARALLRRACRAVDSAAGSGHSWHSANVPIGST